MSIRHVMSLTISFGVDKEKSPEKSGLFIDIE